MEGVRAVLWSDLTCSFSPTGVRWKHSCSRLTSVSADSDQALPSFSQSVNQNLPISAGYSSGLFSNV